MYRSILVAGESLDGLSDALSKAAMLEHYSGAKVTLLEVIYDELEKESDTVLPRAEKERLIAAYEAAELQALSNIAGDFTSRIAQLDTATCWSESRALGICRYALQHQADLVVKPKLPVNGPLGTRRDAVERRLMSQAACPVLISNLPDWVGCRAILACVNVADADHAELNENIVTNGVSLAELLGVSLHLLNVTRVAEPSLRQYLSSREVLRMDERLVASREQKLQALQAKYASAKCEIHYHVRAGNLVEEIESLAQAEAAKVVVMGTAGREGLKRMFIGNSAEVVLTHIDLDLLCVREQALEKVNYGEYSE